MLHTRPHCLLITLALLAACLPATAAYRAVGHRTTLAKGEIAVTAPGVCDKPGATYVLMKDISSPTSGLFLANNVTLDLNGYTLTYAAGNYEHVPNYSFEKGLADWDISKAPGAKVSDTVMIHPLHGRNTCLLPKGQEIVSSYIDLPVANRTYFATAMVANQNQYVTISIEDANGKSVRCTFSFGDQTRVTSPAEKYPPKLGGGTVYAMMYGMPAGKYRVRVKAIGRDAVIDDVDIRPAIDCGVGIVDRVNPWAYYKCVLDGDGPPAFFDYRKPGTTTTPLDSIPRVTGPGTITIKNGVIKAGFRTIQTKGIQSTARQAKTVIENVKLVSGGINANAIDVFQGVMTNCRIEVDTPFIINRHNRAATAARFAGSEPSEISNCEFVGGQGCLTLNGNGGLVHDNLFSGNQTVTNHYSLSLDANGAKIYNNRFEPIRGGGIYIYDHRNNDIYDNTFKITAAPPNNEYSATAYSTNAIRISDYNAKPGSPHGWCAGNNIYNNKFEITSRTYQGADRRYIGVATALFVSVGGGQNPVHDNEIVVVDENPKAKGSEAWAFYIGGSDQGGIYYNNRITSNVTPIWISNRYSQAKNVLLYDNTIIKAKGAEPFVPIICGYYKYPSENIGFYSNKFVGLDFGVKIGDYTTKSSAYDFGWTLKVLTDRGTEVKVLDPDGNEVASGKAGANRRVVFHLAEYKVVGDKKTPCASYVVQAGDFKKKITMTSDREITFRTEPARSKAGGLQVTKIMGFTNIQYDRDYERCALDVFRPADNPNAPLVILIHGGGWTGGSRSQYYQSCIELAKRGFAAATVGYRLLDEAAWPDMAYDVLRGMAYLKSHAAELGIDASKAVTLGSSAGGQLALAMQAKTAEWVSKGIVADAPLIVGTVGQCPAAILPAPGSSPRQAKLANGHPLADYSPGHMDPKLFKSVLIIHGDADEVIPLDKSRQFVRQLNKAGVDATLEVLKGAPHAFGYNISRQYGRQAFEMMMPYLRRIL